MQPLAAVPPFGRWAAAFGRWAFGGGLLRSVGGTAQSAASYAAVATIAYAIARWPPSMLLRLLPRLLHGPSRRPKQQRALSEGEFVPPLPEPVVQVLTRCCLCFLATSNDSAPHLSLMRFSFSSALDDPEKEVVIVSTRRNTKKYQFILENKEVALLVHDFSGEAEEDGQNYEELEGRARHSITLNGIVHEQTGELAERCADFHPGSKTSFARRRCPGVCVTLPQRQLHTLTRARLPSIGTARYTSRATKRTRSSSRETTSPS